MDRPFMPGSTGEHKTAVIALALCALSWERLALDGSGAWVCRMCGATTRGIELWAVDAQHYTNCAVMAAQECRLSDAVNAAKVSGANSASSTFLRIIGEVFQATELVSCMHDNDGG